MADRVAYRFLRDPVKMISASSKPSEAAWRAAGWVKTVGRAPGSMHRQAFERPANPPRSRFTDRLRQRACLIALFTLWAGGMPFGPFAR